MNLKNFILFITVCVAADVYANGIVATRESCEPGWEQHDQWCFYTVREYLSWRRASNNCKKLGGTLPSIHSSEQNAILIDILKRNDAIVGWIGLKNYALNATSRWEDGSVVEYTKWLEGEGHFKGENCAVLNRLFGGWHQTGCHREGISICQKNASTADSTSNQKSGSSVHHRSELEEEHLHACGHGWHKKGNYCYYLGHHKRKWDSAACHCLREGGHLTSIHSKEEQDFLNDFLSKKGINGRVWIGLHDISIEGQYTWEDGSKFEYQNWNKGEPSGVKNSQEDCVELYHDQHGDMFGKWNDIPCSESKTFICKKHVEIKHHKSKEKSEQSAHFAPTTFIFIITILIIALIAQMGVTIYYRRQWLKERPNTETQVLYKSDSRQRIIQ